MNPDNALSSHAAPGRLRRLRRLRWALLSVLLFAVLLGTGVFSTSLLRGESVRQAIRSTSLLHARALLRPTGMDSWSAMWSGRHRLKESAESPHERTLRLDHCKYQYPPSSLLLLELLPAPDPLPLDCRNADGAGDDLKPGQWPAKGALEVASALSTLALIGVSMALLWRGLLPHGQARAAGLTLLGKIGFLLLALAAGLTFYPVLRAHQLGQVQVFINLALGLALMVLRRQPVASGVLVGLCCLFKPQYLLFALWALSRRQWGWLLGLAGTVGLGTLAALFVYGLEPHLQYVAFLQGVARTGEVFWLNQSLNGLLNRLLQTGNPVLWDSSAFPAYHAVVHRGTLLGSLLVLLLALLGRRAATDRELDFAAMLAALTLASPIAWEHHYGCFLPIFGLLLGRLVTANTPRPVGWQLGLLGLSYVLMANAVLRPEWLFSLPLGNGWSLHLWFGALVLFGLLLHGRRQGQAAGSMSAMSALRAGQNPKGAS